MIIEALAFGKAVVVGNFSTAVREDVYAPAGACLYVTEPSELGPALAQAADHEPVRAQLRRGRDEYAERIFHRRDGRSAERVVAAIDALVG